VIIGVGGGASGTPKTSTGRFPPQPLINNASRTTYNSDVRIR